MNNYLTYEEWCELSRQYEYNHALRSLKANQPIDKILEKMSFKIINKLMHPLYSIIEEDFFYDDDDISKSSSDYKENYLDKFNRIANYVKD
jgi:glutamyl-tRNA reductase